jgi:hypothetical protein
MTSKNSDNENNANAALATLLSGKSRQVYGCVCQRFTTWCDEKKVKETVTKNKI